MPQTTADLLRLRQSGDTLHDHGLAQLLDDVCRIADGIGAIEQLAVALAPGPGAPAAPVEALRQDRDYQERRANALRDERDKCLEAFRRRDAGETIGSPAYSQFTRDEQHALLHVEVAIKQTIADHSNYAYVAVSELSMVYKLACESKGRP